MLHDIPHPYLIYAGHAVDALDVKTGMGLVEWRPNWCGGQWRESESVYDLRLPDMTPTAARAAGMTTMVIGVAEFGGRLTDGLKAAVAEAIAAGLNVASGLHDRLNADPDLARAARQAGVHLFDVRGLPPGAQPPVASGRRRTGRRLLTVGTDCAVGKKFTALSLERDLHAAGRSATFRATGQTGVLISGGGVAIDAVAADFLAGVVEQMTPDNMSDHWDIVEGQGSLHHPAYAAVSLGLLHGAQPDAFVVCHEAGREAVLGYETFPLPSIGDCIELVVANGRRLNPDIRCVGVSLNCSQIRPSERAAAKRALEAEAGLPVVDPAEDGTGRLIAAMDGLR